MPDAIPSRSNYAQLGSIINDENSARDFLFRRGILKNNICCGSCSAPMQLVTCSNAKSPDGYIWKCFPCKQFQSLRAGSVLSGKRLSFSLFLLLINALSFCTATNVDVARQTGMTRKSVGDWRSILSSYIEDWFLNNSVGIGGRVMLLKLMKLNLVKESTTEVPTERVCGYSVE